MPVSFSAGKSSALYTEATQAAATLSTTEDGPERDAAEQRFWSLYWGELALVESLEVEQAMAAMGWGLNEGADSAELKQLSLRLAHACRDSLVQSWGVAEWAAPDYGAEAAGAE